MSGGGAAGDELGAGVQGKRESPGKLQGDVHQGASERSRFGVYTKMEGGGLWGGRVGDGGVELCSGMLLVWRVSTPKT